MSSMRALAAMVLAAAAACSDPTFDVAIRYEHLDVEPANDLRAQVTTLTVSVVDASAAGPAAGLAGDASCADVAFGRIAPAVLEGARRASVSALDSPRLSGVPRLGPKLVIAEALDRGGRRVGAGCTRWDDVDDDALVEVDVEVAPRVRVFSREEITTAPSPVQLVVTAPWDYLLPLADRQIVAELHGPAGVVEMPVDRTNDAGLARTPAFDLEEPGPAATLVRVAWADELLRVPAFVQWPTLDTMSGNRVTLAPDDSGRLDRSWVSGQAMVGAQMTWAAAAVQQRGAASEEVVIAFYNGSSRKLAALSVTTPGVRALGLWGGRLYTVTASGWQEIAGGGPVAVPGTADGTGAATAVLALEGCGAAPAGGLLVRRTVGAAEAWRAYDAPGVPAMASTPLAVIAAQLDQRGETAIGQACATLDGAEVRVVVSRGNAFGLVAYLSSGQRIVMPAIQVATSFVNDGIPMAAGVEASVTGPHVSAFQLTNLLIASAAVTGFVQSPGLDAELATVPSSLEVTDLEQDGLLDVIAAIPTIAGPRLQVTVGHQVAGEQLSSVSPLLPGGRQASNAMIRLQDVDGVGGAELVVMTDEGLDVICLDVKPGPMGKTCASAP